VIFNGKNITDPTYQRFVATQSDDIIAKKVSWRDNPFFPEVLNKERIALQQTDGEAYAHIWEGMPDTRRSGAVYAKQLATARDEGRITVVPYDPTCQVFTALDLGYGDATAIWWLQWVGRELRWLEYYENSGEQIDFYAKLIQSKPYNYSKHYLPHDGGHGNIRGDSVSIQLSKLGLSNVVLPREQDINPGIELLRSTIAFSVFDKEKTIDGIHALENYAYEWKEDRGLFSDKPKHDWTSHGSSAARYAAIAARDYASPRIKQGTIKPIRYNNNAWAR
jgi:phage terminase large subunit